MAARLALCLALAALLAPASARADFAIDDFSVEPSTTLAGAHPDVAFSIHFADPSFDVKDVRLDLPPGLIGDPHATGGRCTRAQFQSDSCPSSTIVGSASTQADAIVPITASGDVYNIDPEPGEPARLGIRQVALGSTIRLESPITVRPEDSGLTSMLRDLPNSAAGMPITIRRIDFTLAGAARSGASFMRNPTSCSEAVTRVTATPYGGGQTAAAQSAYTPTSCAAQPFSPSLSAKVGAPGLTGRGSLVPLETVVVQPGGQAGLSEVAVTLPDHLDVNGAGLTTFCTPDQLALRDCPPASQVGTARAETPLLDEPLQGIVVSVKGPTDPLPGLGAILSGGLSLTLRANVGFASDGRIVSTFGGLPDVPVSRFELRFNGGKGGMLLGSADLCVTPTRLEATFRGHSGQTLTQDVLAAPEGCRPRASLKLRGLAGRAPRLFARIAGFPGETLTGAELTLPRGLAFDRRRARRLGSLRGRRKLVLRARAPVIKLVAAKGALVASRSLRRTMARKRSRDLRFTVGVSDTQGLRATLRPRVRGTK
jgi:hypothetical protein